MKRPPARSHEPRDENGNYNLVNGINHRHDAVIDIMLANPDATMKEIAQIVGYSQQWLNRLARTDAFRARYEEKRQQIDGQTLIPLRTKMLGVAHHAVEEVANKLPDLDAQRQLDVFTSVYDRLYGKPSSGGSGGNQGVTINQNFGTIDKNTLARGRARLHQSFQQPEEGDSSDAIEGEVGEVQSESAQVRQASEEAGAKGGGA